MTNFDRFMSEWLAGRYWCVLVPAGRFAEPKFQTWARQLIEEVKEQIALCGKLPPQLLLNILATYHVLQLRGRVRPDRQKKDLKIALDFARMVERRRPDLRFNNPNRDYGTKLTALPSEARSLHLDLQKMEKARIDHACILALSPLFKRHGVKHPWHVISDLLKAALGIRLSADAVRKVPDRLQFEIDRPLDDLFSVPAQAGWLSLVGSPSAYQRLLLMVPRDTKTDRGKTWSPRRPRIRACLK